MSFIEGIFWPYIIFHQSYLKVHWFYLPFENWGTQKLNEGGGRLILSTLFLFVKTKEISYHTPENV